MMHSFLVRHLSIDLVPSNDNAIVVQDQIGLESWIFSEVFYDFIYFICLLGLGEFCVEVGKASKELSAV